MIICRISCPIEHHRGGMDAEALARREVDGPVGGAAVLRERVVEHAGSEWPRCWLRIRCK